MSLMFSTKAEVTFTTRCSGIYAAAARKKNTWTEFRENQAWKAHAHASAEMRTRTAQMIDKADEEHA